MIEKIRDALGVGNGKEGYSFMVDISGSVGGSAHYWDMVGELVTKYGQDISKFYFWDSSIEVTTKKDLETAIAKRTGRGGTSPELVAAEVVKSNIKKLILITDGQVSDSSVQKCDQILNEYALEKSICYIISTGYGLNMSVTCPFTRKCDNEVYEKENGQPLKQLVQYTPEDYKILDTLDEITLENFESSYDKIEGLIIALNMGKEGNIPLKNQLVVMKNRLVKELSKKEANTGEQDLSLKIRELLEKKDFSGAIEIAQKITKDYFSNDMTDSLEKKVSHLINLCGDLRGKYNIGQIKSNKMAWADTAAKGELAPNLEVTDLSKNPIECPIILDDDVPQILVDECEPVFLGIEKNIVDDISACPLRILNYPEVKAKLKSRLSNYMGVKYADKFLKNPFTQNRLLGAIPLGSHPSHVKVGNYTIAKMISGGKILGNLNLFYAAIWYIIKEHEIEYLVDVEKNATEHLLYRLKNSRTMASLCGLAQFVTTELTSDVAVWYCANSGFLNQPTGRDTFRFHVFNILPLIDIVNALDYPIDKGVEAHILRTKALLSSLSFFKKLSTNEKRDFKEKIRCLTQNSVKVNREAIAQDVLDKEAFVEFIPIDGDSNAERADEIIATLPRELKKLTLGEIIYFGNLLDAQKSASDYFINYDFDCPAKPTAEINWKYGLTKYDQPPQKICKKTFRPYSTKNGVTWEENYSKAYSVPADSAFKGRKYFEEFLIKFNRFPNKEELLIFYYNRYVIGGKSTTLPFLADHWAYEMVTEYGEALAEFELTVPQALALLEASRPRDARLVLEEGGDLLGSLLDNRIVVTMETTQEE